MTIRTVFHSEWQISSSYWSSHGYGHILRSKRFDWVLNIINRISVSLPREKRMFTSSGSSSAQNINQKTGQAEESFLLYNQGYYLLSQYRLTSITITQVITFHHQFSSVAQACLTLCDPMNHSTPGIPVHHQHPESTQTHVH